MIGRKFVDGLLNALVFLSLVFVAIIAYAAYEEQQHKQKFDAMCIDSGGIPLRYTYHYDKKQNKIEYTCLSTNAVIDVE